MASRTESYCRGTCWLTPSSLMMTKNEAGSWLPVQHTWDRTEFDGERGKTR